MLKWPGPWPLLALASTFAAACNVDTSSVCIGACPTAPLQKTLWAVGFPQGRVDRSALGPSGYYFGKLPVGESVTLYEISTAVPGYAADTIRQVVWGLSDAVAAGIEAQPNGGGRLTGRASGAVSQVLGNGTPLVVWSCPANSGTCDRLGGILITP